jgi:peptide/nickel transport system substrate-binding protein
MIETSPFVRSKKPRATSKTAVRIGALVLTALLGVTACGGGASSGAGATTDTSTFTYALTGLPTSLDPADYQGDPSRNIGFEEGSSLFQWDTENLPNQGCDTLANVGQLKGELAESQSRSADGKTITVKLRPAKSSAGNILTANDVKWTFDRLIALKVGTPNTLMYSVAHYAKDPISVVDDSTLEIHVDAASAMDTAILTWAQFRILDSVEVKKHVTADDPWGKKFLATTSANFGPWMQAPADFDAGNRLTLTRNPNYWGPRGDVQKLIFLSVPDASSRAQLLKTGDATYAAGLQYDQYASLKTAPGVEVQTCASADRIPLVLNAKDPNLGKPEVRQAVSMAIDRDAIVKAVFKGFNKPSQYGLSQAYEFPHTAAGTYTYDPVKAKALLASAGVTNPTITLTMSPARPGPEAEQISILIKSQLAAVGITANIQTVASATEVNTIYHDGSFQSLLYLEPPAVADPFYSLFLYNSSRSELDTYGYKNTQLDDLTEQVSSTDPGPARDKLISSAAEQVVQDPPFIYLVDKQFVHAVRSGFTNYQHTPNGELFVHTLKRA